jgi:lipopolysaccharide transport system permease protein
VFYFVFEVILNRGGGGFVVFLLCGQIPFLWFARSVNNASNSIMAGRGLIMQTAIPKSFFPLLVVAQDLVKQVVVFVCLLGLLIAMGYGPSLTWSLLPVVIVVQVLLVAAVALLAASITPLLPDFQFMVNTGMTMLMFASGIFYDYRQVLLPEHQMYFLLNPLASLIEAYRDILMRHSPPDWSRLGYIALASMGLVGVMMRVFRRHDATYARLVTR